MISDLVILQSFNPRWPQSLDAWLIPMFWSIKMEHREDKYSTTYLGHIFCTVWSHANEQKPKSLFNRVWTLITIGWKTIRQICVGMSSSNQTCIALLLPGQLQDYNRTQRRRDFCLMRTSINRNIWIGFDSCHCQFVWPSWDLDSL